MKADGTVIVYGNFEGDVSQLKDIVYIDAQILDSAIVGLDKNGTLHIVDEQPDSPWVDEKQGKLKIDGYNINAE